jgi:hypothetical protein
MPNAAKNEMETKPLVAASVGAGEVWSGAGTFMVARAGGEHGLGIVRSPILMLWGPLWSPAARGRFDDSSTNQRGRAGDHQAPAKLLALPPKHTEEPHEQ